MPMENTVAIIGAGLSGLSLALALHQQGISCTLYESRAAPLDIGGAIMLSPNALKILDSLGVYGRVRPLGFEFESLFFRSENDRPVDTFEFGSKDSYGYKALRVYRFELISVLLEMLLEAGVKVEYGKKFVRMVGENQGAAWSGSSRTVRSEGVSTRPLRMCTLLPRYWAERWTG
jgi:2-polyprenyl-6-methoxyphenol hydroxylase-like FAD-dependent oxidoreductase